MEHFEPVVDLEFRVQGETIPADHGYALYGAVSRVLPAVHGDRAVGIHPITGRLVGGRALALTPASRLVLRLPVTLIPPAVGLAGERLDLGSHHLLVGVPATRPLRPAPVVASRLVTVKGFTEPDGFLDAVARQVAALGIAGRVALLAPRGHRPAEGGSGSRSPVVRRTLRIRDKEVVGFAVGIAGLSPTDSLRLQAAGVGGRRRFGCGIFVPVAAGGGP
jgi:CRISPR-associated protein Cas6